MHTTNLTQPSESNAYTYDLPIGSWSQKIFLFLIPSLICLEIKIWNAYTPHFDAYTLPYRGQNAWPNIPLLKPKWSMTISKLSYLYKSVLN